MPSTITHTYLGIDVCNKLNYHPKKVLKERLESYKTYAQGMDILYFYKILILKSNKIQRLGHRFHNYKTLEIFRYLINLNKENQDFELFTFICGLITHYRADAIIHPYINYLSNNSSKVKTIDKHFEIETYIDNYMLSKKNPKYYKYKNYKLQFNTKKSVIVNKAINDLFQKFFNTQNMGIKYYHSLKEMRFIYKHLRYDPLGIKKKLYGILDYNPFKIRRVKYLSYNFILNKDEYLNNSHTTWYNICDKSITSNKSFMELYDQVVIETSNIINKLYSYIFLNKQMNIDKIIGNYSYATGLSLIDKD